MYLSKRWLLIVAIAIFGVIALSLFGSWRTNVELQEQQDRLKHHVSCQTSWNSFLSRSLEARSTASFEAQAAMDELIRAISESTSPDESRRALAIYKAAREKQIATLKKNPIPKPPEEICNLKE